MTRTDILNQAAIKNGFKSFNDMRHKLEVLPTPVIDDIIDITWEEAIKQTEREQLLGPDYIAPRLEL